MSDISALEAFALRDRRQALSSGVWAPGSSEAAFYTGLQALHDGDLEAAQRQLESLETINRHSSLCAELKLRLQLASWDAATGNEGQRARLLEELRQTAGVEFGSFEAADGDGAESATAAASDEEQQAPSQLLPEQYSGEVFLEHALAAGLAAGSHSAGQQTDYNRLRLFGMEQPPQLAAGMYDAAAWRRHRWAMLQAADNPAALPGVVQFIAHTLADPGASAGAFSLGDLPLAKLTLAQLHELAVAWPAARGSDEWIAAVVLKMYPQLPADELSVAQRSAFLEAVQDFCRSLPNQGGWLRIRVMQAQLQLHEEADTVDAELFIEYVRLGGALIQDWERSAPTELAKELAFEQPHRPGCYRYFYGRTPGTGHLLDPDLQGVGLQQFEMRHMKRVISHHLAAGNLDSIRVQWKDLFDVDYEARMVAEASLLAGVGDALQHANRLKYDIKSTDFGRSIAERVQELQERVELVFPPCNPKRVLASEGVTLQLDVKNVPLLLVKVYEINTRAYYTAKRREVPIDIQLEGLGATSEQAFDYGDVPAMRRHRESIPLPDLQGKRGVFVVEAMGGGLTSRAVISKGSLTHVARVSAAGTAVTILDDSMQVVTDGRVCLNGEEYPVDAATGEATIPFAASPGNSQPAVLIAGDCFAALARLDHHAESYSLAAGFWADREALQPGTTAPMLLWTALRGPTGGAAPLALLQDVALTITYTDCDGVDSRQTFSDVKLAEGGQAQSFQLRLPERCAAIAAELTARVELSGHSGEQFQDLRQAHRWDINDSTSGSVIGDLHLRCQPKGGFTLQALGRCGEVLPKRAVTVRLQHDLVPGFSRDFRLQTDEEGSIDLGPLTGGIANVSAKLGAGAEREWALPFVRPTLPTFLHVAAGSEQEVVVDFTPADTGAANLATEGVQLLSQAPACGGTRTAMSRANAPLAGGAVAELSACLGTSRDGRLALRSLPEGRHTLYFPRAHQSIDITAVKQHGSLQRGGEQLLLGSRTLVAASPSEPLRVAELRASPADGLRLQLEGADAGGCRATVAFSRFVPTACDEPLHGVAAAVIPRRATLQRSLPLPASAYSSGKRLSEETRYCLERRRLEQQGKIRTGNQCAKPSLLVHPWSVRKTSAEERLTRGGEEHHADRFPVGCGACAAPSAAFGARARMARVGGGSFFTAPRLGFCTPPALLSNVKVRADGTLSISADALRQRGMDLAQGGFTAVSVVAVSSAGQVASGFQAVDAAPGTPPQRDQGLVRALAPQSRCIQVSAVDVMLPGASLRITDATSSKVNLCDDAAKLWALFGTLLAGKGQEQEFWRAFDFLPSWHTLAPAQKITKLQEHACHELHFFVHQRDPELFQSAVLPLLQNKLDHELGAMDLWLLGRHGDLVSRHGSPATFAQLNALEACLLAAAAGDAAGLAVDMASRCRHTLRSREAAAAARRRFDMALQAADDADQDGIATQLESWKQEETARAARPPPPPAPAMAFATFGGASGSAPGGGSGFPPPPPEGRGRFQTAWVRGAPAQKKAAEPDPLRATVLDSASPQQGSSDSEWEDVPHEGSQTDSDFELVNDGADDEQSSDGGDEPEDPDMALRRLQRKRPALYKPPEPTQEWVEAGYWKQRRLQQPQTRVFPGDTPSARVPESLFWADFAAHLAVGNEQPFLSQHLAHAGQTFTDAVAALAVTAVGFCSPEGGHAVVSSAGGMVVTAAAPAVAFHRQIQAVEADADTAGGSSTVSVVQRLYDGVDRYMDDEVTGEKAERAVSGPLRSGRPYGYHVIVSSTAAVPLALDVLVQVPQGALPLEQKPFSWCTRINVAPYTSATLDLPFYFPRPSDTPSTFQQFPVTISRDSRLVAASEAAPALAVQCSPAPAAGAGAGFDWGRFIRTAPDEEVLTYLREGDLARSQLPALQRRCRRRGFFVAATTALRSRRVWCPELWRYALMHGEQRALAELLPTLPALTEKLTPPVDSSLLRLPIQEHKEYWPLVAPRTHALGGRPAVEDSGLREALAALLGSLARQRAPPPAEHLKAVVLLLAQDRVDEAEELFAELRAHVDSLPTMQVDYLTAWLALAASPVRVEIAAAAGVVKKYGSVADKHWAARWAELRTALAEAGATIPAGNEHEDAGAAEELPSLAIASGPGAGQVTLRHHGLAGATLAAYEMDVELLFSAQPFGQNVASRAARGNSVNPAYVKPRATAQLALDGSLEETVLTLTDVLPQLSAGGASLLVEARAEGVPPVTASCFSSGLRVRVTPRAGLLHASCPSDAGEIDGSMAGDGERRPAMATYVKVFARRRGSAAARFHKDGYTDVRGRFDYVTTTGTPDSGGGFGVGGSAPIERFAILVASRRWGTVIEEAPPPATLL